MDTKEIVERVIKGEDYSTLVKDLPSEKQIEVGTAVRDALDSQIKMGKGDLKKATEDLISVRQGIDKIKEKQNESQNQVIETFKKEQVEKAKKKFFSSEDFPLTNEQKTQLETELSNKNFASTDSDFVFEEIKKVYGSLFIDQVLSEKKKAIAGQNGAQQFIINQAGANNSGPVGDPDKYSTPVKELWAAVQSKGFKNYTLDKAKEDFEKGRSPSSTRYL